MSARQYKRIDTEIGIPISLSIISFLGLILSRYDSITSVFAFVYIYMNIWIVNEYIKPNLNDQVIKFIVKIFIFYSLFSLSLLYAILTYSLISYIRTQFNI